MISKHLGELKDYRPEGCKVCDYDWYEDCIEGCKKLEGLN